MALSVKAGTYTGDGATTKAITGIGFLPKVVIVSATLGTGDASATCFKTTDMSTGATGRTSNMGENGNQTTGEIDSLDADGFTVRDQKNINTRVYYYIAFAGTSCVAGTYAGDGTDNRAITGVGFRPKWMVTQGGTGHSFHKSTATGNTTDSAQYTTVLADVANTIQSLDADGFTLGNLAGGPNAAATTHYYFCLDGANVTSGTYAGNATDNRAVTGVGFTPISVLVKDTALTNQATLRTGESGDLSSKVRANTAPLANAIQSLDADGFTIGTDGTVNTNLSNYYWVAFGATPAAAAGGSTLSMMGV